MLNLSLAIALCVICRMQDKVNYTNVQIQCFRNKKHFRKIITSNYEQSEKKPEYYALLIAAVKRRERKNENKGFANVIICYCKLMELWKSLISLVKEVSVFLSLIAIIVSLRSCYTQSKDILQMQQVIDSIRCEYHHK